jgi:PAS domain S-box-containing protein
MPFAKDLIRRFASCLLGVLALSAWAHGQAPVEGTVAADDGRIHSIVFGGDREFPPLESVGRDGTPQGFQIELIREIARVNEWEVRTVLGPWSEIHAKFLAGEIDVIGMADQPERRVYADFADPHSVYASEIFHRQGTPEADSLEALSGREVIVQRGALADEWFAANKVVARIIRAETEADALRLLASGQHDFAVVTQFGGRAAMQRLALTNLTTCGPLVLQSDYAFAVRKGRQGLLAGLNQGQAILKRTGQYNQIYDRWLGGVTRPSVPLIVVRRAAIWVGIPLLVFALGSLLWNRALHHQVALRTATVREELARREAAQLALAESEARYKTLTAHAPEAILVIDPVSMRIIEVNENAAWLFKKDHDALIQSDPLTTLACVRPDESLDPLDAQRLIGRAMNAESVQAERIVRDGLGASIPCELRLVRLIASGRWLIRVSITDISERRDAERRQRTMMSELDHRVKNSLAMVSGLAQHMLADSPDPAQFADAFTERLRAMGSAHEALARAQWDGVHVADAIAMAMRPYGPWPNPRLSIMGDNPMLGPDHATPVCMVLHELAVNAAKHGALAQAGGTIDVDVKADDHETLHLTWVEHVPGAAEPTLTGGVGFSLIKGLVEYQLRGTATVEPHPGGIAWTIWIPSSTPAPVT